MNARIKIRELNEGLSLIEIGSILFGIIYVSGYLVNAIYVRSRGIAPLPLLKAQYIETGLVFVILTGLIASTPILITQMAVYGRVKHGQMVTPTIVIPIVITTNFLLVIIFWAIFITEYEWEAIAGFYNVIIPLKVAITCYLLSMLLLLPSLPIIRMANFNKPRLFLFPTLSPEIDNTITSKPIYAIIQVLRTTALIITIAFDIILFISIRWLPRFAIMGFYYIVTVIFLIGSVYLVKYLSGIFGEKNKRIGIWAVSIPLILSCYYFSVTAYSYVIYNNIPVSRGGKYPTTKAILTLKYDSQHEEPNGFYVLEETDDILYVLPTTLENWFTSHEEVFVISKKEVCSYRIVHLSSGEPRVNQFKGGSTK